MISGCTLKRRVSLMGFLRLLGRDCPRRRPHAAVELSGASAGRFLRPGARSATLDGENGVTQWRGQQDRPLPCGDAPLLRFVWRLMTLRTELAGLRSGSRARLRRVMPFVLSANVEV